MDFPIRNCRLDCKTKLHESKPYPVEIKIVLNTHSVIVVNDLKRLDNFAVATDFSVTGQFFQSVTNISNVISSINLSLICFCFLWGRKKTFLMIQNNFDQKEYKYKVSSLIRNHVTCQNLHQIFSSAQQRAHLTTKAFSD